MRASCGQVVRLTTGFQSLTKYGYFGEYRGPTQRLICAMKTLLLSLTLAAVAAGSAGTAHAQVFKPSATSGAVIGAVAGGLIGGHNDDRWAQGAVIGGIAGALIGAAVAPQEQRVYSPAPPVVYAQPTTTVIQTAPTVPMAPTVVSAPPPPVTVVQPPAQVVYVEHSAPPPPRVVYVQPAPRVVYVQPAPPPVVSFGIHYSSGPRYDGRHDRRHDHRGHGHGRR